MEHLPVPKTIRTKEKPWKRMIRMCSSKESLYHLSSQWSCFSSSMEPSMRKRLNKTMMTVLDYAEAWTEGLDLHHNDIHLLAFWQTYSTSWRVRWKQINSLVPDEAIFTNWLKRRNDIDVNVVRPFAYTTPTLANLRKDTERLGSNKLAKSITVIWYNDGKCKGLKIGCPIDSAQPPPTLGA